MSKPVSLPRWADSGAVIVEPSAPEKDVGWVAAQVPPASYFNWWQNLTYQWAVWLDAFESTAHVWTTGTQRFTAAITQVDGALIVGHTSGATPPSASFLGTIGVHAPVTFDYADIFLGISHPAFLFIGTNGAGVSTGMANRMEIGASSSFNLYGIQNLQSTSTLTANSGSTVAFTAGSTVTLRTNLNMGFALGTLIDGAGAQAGFDGGGSGQFVSALGFKSGGGILNSYAVALEVRRKVVSVIDARVTGATQPVVSISGANEPYLAGPVTGLVLFPLRVPEGVSIDRIDVLCENTAGAGHAIGVDVFSADTNGVADDTTLLVGTNKCTGLVTYSLVLGAGTAKAWQNIPLNSAFVPTVNGYLYVDMAFNTAGVNVYAVRARYNYSAVKPDV